MGFFVFLGEVVKETCNNVLEEQRRQEEEDAKVLMEVIEGFSSRIREAQKDFSQLSEMTYDEADEEDWNSFLGVIYSWATYWGNDLELNKEIFECEDEDAWKLEAQCFKETAEMFDEMFGNLDDESREKYEEVSIRNITESFYKKTLYCYNNMEGMEGEDLWNRLIGCVRSCELNLITVINNLDTFILDSYDEMFDL